jgi:hypothetical protein
MHTNTQMHINTQMHTNTQMNELYNDFYRMKFGERPYILTMTGHVINSRVNLVLDDLYNITDIGNILDFFRKIEKEGDFHMIIIPGNNCYTFCRHRNLCNYCVECNFYSCVGCSHTNHTNEKCKYSLDFYESCGRCGIVTHEPLVNGECYDCTNNSTTKAPIAMYSKPVCSNFNMYEWVPVRKNTLENRNPMSTLYKRRIVAQDENNKLRLRLISLDDVRLVDIVDKYLHNQYLRNSIMGIEIGSNARSSIGKGVSKGMGTNYNRINNK